MEGAPGARLDLRSPHPQCLLCTAAVLSRPRRKVGKAATDLSLVFGGLQEQRVNQSNGVGLDLLIGAVSTEMEAGSQRTKEQDDSAHDTHTQLKTHCDRRTGGLRQKSTLSRHTLDPLFHERDLSKTGIRKLGVTY